MDSKQFFYRNVIFSKLGDSISIIDINDTENPGEKLDQWFGLVLQLADGQHTIDQLLMHLSGRYNGNPPAGLQQTIESVIERMVKSKFIVLTDEATQLPYYLSAAVETLDIERAKQLMKEDGSELN